MQIVLPVLTIVSLCGLPIPAYAYIDPGTAGMALQILIGAVAAVGVTLKLYWHKLAGLFKRKPQGADEQPNAK